uniref:G_PROTEIN_RECEP_F1_2 domain-containing protein n=1 Tax=Steinernema glaseri TaxID=37863 RepID=A0A1I7ZVD1_9BILA
MWLLSSTVKWLLVSTVSCVLSSDTAKYGMVKYDPANNYSLDEFDFQYVQLHGAILSNGTLLLPPPNPLFGLAYVLSMLAAVALGANVALILYSRPQTKCSTWISRCLMTVVCYVNVVGLFLVFLPFVYSISTGTDVFRGCYVCCQTHTYLAAGLRGGLFLMALLVVHQFCAEKHDVPPNPPRGATADQLADRRCKSVFFFCLPVAAAAVLFPDLSFTHDPVFDHRFHQCVSPPWHSLEISQFPVGAFAFPALFYYYWTRLLRHCIVNRAWVSVKAIIPAILLFFFYPCIYIPYLAISQYGSPHFDRQSWIPAAALALTYADLLALPFVYAPLMVYSKRRIFPKVREEEVVQLT